MWTKVWRGLLWLLLGVIALSAGVVLSLRWIDPPVSAFILHASAAGEVRGPAWTQWDQISPWVPMAIVAAEDQKFPHHRGFDIQSIHKAVQERIERGRVRGASTISQQLAKNLFLWPERSWVRKGVEAYFTVLLEAFLPKRRILELYMNLAEFGPAMFGVSMAAQSYFSKRPAQLAPEEACLLAAILPNPKALSVNEPSAATRKKAQWIRAQIQALGGTGYLDALR